MAGFWDFLGKISEWFPSPQEKRRNDIKKLKAKMLQLQNKPGFNFDDSVLYSQYAKQLQELQDKSQNFG